MNMAGRAGFSGAPLSDGEGAAPFKARDGHVDALFLIVAAVVACFIGGYALRCAVTARRRARPIAAEGEAVEADDTGTDVAAPVQALVPLFSAERDFLKRENARLNSHIDRLMGLLEHEQTLRRQMQEDLVRMIVASNAPAQIGTGGDHALRAELLSMRERLEHTERRYRRLKGAVEVLLRRLRNQGDIAAAA
jgi:hypothetical protein